MIRKKIEKLKVLMRPESRLFREKLPKTMEFGHEFTVSYNRHSGAGQVKKIIYNPNIRAFVSYNEKQMHIWKEDNAVQLNQITFFDETQSHNISCIVYSPKNFLYFAVSTDFKLFLFNEHLILIGWLPLDVRLVHYMYFCETNSVLITAGIDGCFMFKLNL